MRGNEQYPGRAGTPEPGRRRAVPPSAQLAARVAATGGGADLSAEMVMDLQRTVGNAAVANTLQRSSVPGVLSSAGRPLDEPVRQDMEARLGADLSDVRLHTDAAARASAAEVGARAYTSGNHVVLGEGGADRHTLAHELIHVIQQRRGPVAGTDNGSGLKISDPSDRFEREAEANATRILRQPAPVTAGAPSDQDTASAFAGSATAVQRVHSKADWADSSLTEQKKNLAKPAAWGAAAMHHKISKERLEEIAGYLDKAMRNGNEAAKAFHATCLKTVDKVVRGKSYDTTRLLWNMAANISVGPQSPVGDPGMQFDADTEPDPDAPGLRRMDEVSQHLKHVEDLWMAARADEEKIDDVWGGMNTSMQAAVEAHERVAGAAGGLAQPKLEQWMADTVEGRTSHHRKGLRAFPGEQAGTDLFTKSWVNAEGLEGARAGGPVSRSVTKEVDGKLLKLTMSVTGEAIYHICRRHTFKYFDFDDIKGVNNFWPVGTDVEQVRGIVENALSDIVQACFEYYLERSGIEVESYDTPGEVKLKNIPAGDQTVFVIGAIDDVEKEETGGGGVVEAEAAEAVEPVESESSRPKGKSKRVKMPKALTKFTARLGKSKVTPKGLTGKAKAVEAALPCWHYTGSINTLAPDGRSSQTFLSSELQAIRTALLASATTGSDQ